MGFMELRVGTVGFRVPSLPIFLILGTTQNLKRLPNGSRSKETVNNKTKMQSELFLYLFFSKKWIFWTYFINFHTFPYKFKVQRTPTEFGPPVSLITISSRGQETREIDNLKLDTKICRVVVLDSIFGFS